VRVLYAFFNALALCEGQDWELSVIASEELVLLALGLLLHDTPVLVHLYEVAVHPLAPVDNILELVL